MATDPRIERSRAAILAGARAVLHEEGWEAVTQERVAARAGVGRATVYRHWPDRANLLVDAIEEDGSAMHGKPVGDLRTDLIAELDRFRAAMSQPSQLRLLAALAHYAGTDPDIERARNRMVAIHGSFIRQAVSQGVKTGELDKTVDPDHAVAVLMGPACYRLLLSGEPTSRQFIEEVVDRVIAAYRPKRRAPARPGPSRT
jgi:AcrR family transcriptional regulator